MLSFNKISKKSSSDEEIAKLKFLYRKSFPRDEQIPFRTLLSKSDKDFVDFLAVYDDDMLIGLVYLMHDDDLTYLSYLAVDDEFQSRGFGSQILQALKKEYTNQRICLTYEKIDPKADNNAQRLARKKFYDKNGFDYLNFYIEEYHVLYSVMSNGRPVNPKEYADLKKKFFGKMLYFMPKDKIYK
ncbi:GNAT family N-acetyltransferase [Floricoccus penangensis]|uniref:GNAT family N-acetyltransferase n=1 Tax=Floricoccus penangensis TaxID=1859475 RepID=UPI002040DC44|nr:GNAT family N-acetyltransferase [Floricoccus penangensis]URZ86643.1 GNAT family N-acetyltransferase [Floricoccus penangensis]